MHFCLCSLKVRHFIFLLFFYHKKFQQQSSQQSLCVNELNYDKLPNYLLSILSGKKKFKENISSSYFHISFFLGQPFYLFISFMQMCLQCMNIICSIFSFVVRLFVVELLLMQFSLCLFRA